MVRQAHTYLAGAVSGSALIAAAVVGFVLLVSLQALRDWPLAGIGGGSDSSAVSSGRPAAGAASGSTVGVGGAAVRSSRAAARNAARHGTGAGGSRQHLAAAAPGTSTSPAAGTSPLGEGPGSSPPGAGATGDSGQSTSSSSGGGGGGGGGGEGSGPVSLPGSGGSGKSPAGTIAGAVNDTVSGVDQATGGTLGNTGVTGATEEVVNGVAGPESTVGETVDKVVETVGGLLDGKR